MAKDPSEGDLVSLKGRIEHVWDDGTVTVYIHGYGHPVTLDADDVEIVERRKLPRRRVIRDKPD